ncbi:MAG: peptidylprolyl isomerase [Opitutus sp.]|nr:peptidylprolyl isomerase [Opitutus sp.]MCS6247769.1 peptidylprolyl isomerase [Opitutus sp.]MCS6274249.1 peptidylprolyl isomerase [Opitutus sp.]MCS6278012.1 peptidylprolyl isomerase [Opitutus sp.]MCS6298880.1 peptidylprolyl isomerase [Opitutus sp.]
MSRNIVTFHYTLRDPQGRLLDTSAGGQPISYLEGAGQIIDGLDEALRGLSAGTKQFVQVPAAKAYGEHDPAQVQRVLKSLLPVEGELNPGDQFRAGADQFAPIVRVVEVDGDEVLLDANHPLAGVDLNFEVELTAVREASAEELAHGHAHQGEGGCCGGGEGGEHDHGHAHGEAGGCCGGKGGGEGCKGGGGHGHGEGAGGCGCSDKA